MTLIVAADAQDHLILAGDHCAVLSRVSNQGPPDLVLRNYRKVYPWKYGAIAVSGDVFLAACFQRLFAHQERMGQPIDLLQVARDAKAVRARSGAPPSESTGNLFFTLPGCDGFALHCVFIRADSIECEIIEPIGSRFSMREGTPDEAACHAFNKRLRPSFFFPVIDAFHRHHLELLGRFFAGQSAVDEFVTASFDVYMLEKRTGLGAFWHVSESQERLATIELQVADGCGLIGSAPAG
ncbi:hypothetical protein QFW77_05700 [Luteimonas sp. RD2P54]|uniref:Uncharacterized protein n=1 Tax=Luteimonas endophytica TaxID=3042023 RepID=A0ABT6J6V4_9GAMM|nr:hypothetical protein [Luteimonas endophytica]MDH5822484.1 hypothetical protein [Luteimonas endophytica]